MTSSWFSMVTGHGFEASFGFRLSGGAYYNDKGDYKGEDHGSRNSDHDPKYGDRYVT